ncbi:hypothetical protein QBC40DRAFT_280221 [Triangularia verruculosa]|uniref:Thioredoxin domain-containing protein n=1 Tax=Triangularia verruculosa TaxID=2587418 RepID=A0AAN6XIL8_9PEZI|nr:hypothetical protein QBC40DRAFT_280221 [Triangularia verruculosa]
MYTLLFRPARVGHLSPQAKSFKTVFACIQKPLAVSRVQFSTSPKVDAKNQVYASVRNLDQFHTYQLLSGSSRTPLLTLWSASYCPTCKVVEPLIRELVESGVGEAEGGVGYCEVEFDAPDVMSAGLGMTYTINALPTLLSFDAQEAQVETKITDARKMANRQFLEEWIRTEARRQGNRGGGGGNFLSSLFGKL